MRSPSSLLLAVLCASQVTGGLLVGCGRERVTAPDRTPPGTVTDLAVVSTTDTTVTLTWTAPSNDSDAGRAREYDVRYAETSLETIPWTEAVRVLPMFLPGLAGAAETLRVEGLARQARYSFAVKSSDEHGNWSDRSNVVWGNTSDSVPPATITDLAAAVIDHRSILFSWTAPGDDEMIGRVSGYEVRYGLRPITAESWARHLRVDFFGSPQEAGAQEELVVEGLLSETTYYLALKSVDDGGNLSDLSNIAFTTTTSDFVPPGQIYDLREAFAKTRSIILQWTAPGDDGTVDVVSTYDVRYSDSPITEEEWGSATPAHFQAHTWAPPGEREQLEIISLRPGFQYYFRVKARDEAWNYSPLSNVIAANTKRSNRTWNVREDGSGDAPTIQAAIDSAGMDDCVQVGPGRYRERIDFKGKAILVKGSGAESTVLYGGVAGGPGACVVFISGEDRASELRDFTITGGTGHPFYGDRRGGGIHISNSEPTIRSNIITGNEAYYYLNGFRSGYGGGIYCVGGYATKSPLIEDNVISENRAGGNAGGIGVSGGAPIIRNNVITGNSTEHGDGGGIWVFGGEGTVIDGNVIQDNRAGDHGGGLYVANHGPNAVIHVDIVGNLIASNVARFSSGALPSGGGISLFRAEAEVRNNTIVLNIGLGPDSTSGGGIGMEESATSIIEQNIVAFSQGGGIRCDDTGPPTIRNNLAWQNTGGDGVGLCQGWEEANGNIVADPYFCGRPRNPFTVAENSPALTHPEGPLGAFPDPDCAPVDVRRTTWGRLKARYGQGN